MRCILYHGQNLSALICPRMQNTQLTTAKANATILRRLWTLTYSALSFALLYGSCSALALHLRTHAHLDPIVPNPSPFWPWLLPVYLTSVLFYIASFLLTQPVVKLQTLALRLLLATAVACICFACVPLMAPPRPVYAEFYKGLYLIIDLFDRPFNQAPSLHAAFAVIFLHHFRPVHWALDGFIRLWLMALALSTFLVYQHHPLDTALGLSLGLACVWIIKSQGMQAHARVAAHYACFALACLVFAICAVRAQQTLAALVCVYLGAMLALLSNVYLRVQNDFLAKAGLGKSGTRFPLRSYLYFAPLLGVYKTLWVLHRAFGGGKATQRANWLVTSGRMSTSEAKLYENYAVIDLSNELSAPISFSTYLYLPWLDLIDLPVGYSDRAQAFVSTARAKHQPVLIYCSMGISRSPKLAAALLSQEA
jgi:hypothetical protein